VDETADLSENAENADVLRNAYTNNERKIDMATKKSVSLSVGRGEKLPASKGAGLTAKGREKYNAATGSNLKAPAPNPKTKADQGRKDSFCARMGAVAANAKDGERAKAALKRWKC